MGNLIDVVYKNCYNQEKGDLCYDGKKFQLKIIGMELDIA